VILESWLKQQSGIEFLSVLLPESFAYAVKSAGVRRLVRETFRVEEIIELPEQAFQRTAAATLGIVGSVAEPSTSVLVTHVAPPTLRSFRLTGVAQSFTTQLPPQEGDPWSLSPFYRELQRAQSKKEADLGNVADPRLGLQVYGSPPGTVSEGTGRARRLLEEPQMFASWRPSHWRRLQTVTGPVKALRRSGPIDLYEQPKVLVRTTTGRHQRGRLAAIADTQGLWFTDKFIGIWVREDRLPLTALAAYLQTRFVELWLATNNPSRKLRIGTLERLPIPRLTDDWWQRASELIPENQFVISPRWRQSKQASLLEEDLGEIPDDDWRWFEDAVEAAFGITATAGGEMDRLLKDYLHAEGFRPQ
jgi:hypothetical protein